MEINSILQTSALSLEGFIFEKDVFLPIEKDVCDAFFPPSIEPDAGSLIVGLTILMKLVMEHKDVYRRLRGDTAFWLLISSAWKPLMPLRPDTIDALVATLIAARSEKPSSSSTRLETAVDNFSALRVEVRRMKKADIPGLNGAPSSVPIARLWPDIKLGDHNGAELALIAEPSIRADVYGVDADHPGADGVEYPKNYNGPVETRKYLALEILELYDPSAPGILYPVPVAFLDHDARKAWYKPTGQKSRYYGTVAEFLTFARQAFTGRQPKRHVFCLLTPWFTSVEELAATSASWKCDSATAWPKVCPRSGLVLVIERGSKVRKTQRWRYQVTIFDPRKPCYKGTLWDLPADQRARKAAWLKGLEDALDTFDVYHAWIGGTSKARHDLLIPARRAQLDPVELSCDFIAELVREPATLPTSPTEWSQRHFQRLTRWLPPWDPKKC